MKLGVFSDVHDNLEALSMALAAFESHGIDTALFLGDFCSPIAARAMGRDFPGTIHCILGNGDGDPFTILKLATEELTNLKLHGVHAELDIDGVRLAMTHYPLYGQALARTGDYAAVFSGHTHEVSETRHGDCLWLNPGDIMGLNGRSTCALYDTRSNSARILELDA